jgi:AFG3 family protein
VTIIPRSKGSLGFAQYLPDEVSLYTKEQLVDLVKVALGGRIAESIFFKTVTTGASDDIKKVTQYTTGMVHSYGMTDMGVVSYSSLGNEYVKSFSNATQEKLDAEVRSIVDSCYKEMEELLTEKKDLIEALAEELLSKETLNLSQIMKVLGDRPFPLKESVKKYLGELEERLAEDA